MPRAFSFCDDVILAEISEISLRFDDFRSSQKNSRFHKDLDFKISSKISTEVYKISASGRPLGLTMMLIVV